MVLRVRATLVFASTVAFIACRDEQRDREQVRQAILARLQNSAGLDLKTVDVNTTAVTFDKKMAYATVAFHPKDDPKIGNDMTMKYTLEDRNGKWMVVSVADSQGHGLSGHTGANGAQLPAGHPPVDGAALGGEMSNPHQTDPGANSTPRQ